MFLNILLLSFLYIRKTILKVPIQRYMLWKTVTAISTYEDKHLVHKIYSFFFALFQILSRIHENHSIN